MSILRAFYALALGATLLLPGRAAADILYAADGSGGNLSNLYIIDPTSGAMVQNIGPIGFSVTGLAFDPTTGILYGSTSRIGQIPPSIITINTVTGQGTLVGPIDLGGEVLADISFDPQGNLFGWLEPFGDDLASVNKATGKATIVGEAGVGTAVSGLAFDANGVLFFGGRNSVNNTGLLGIDPANGANILTIGYAPLGDFGMGLAFDSNDVLFGLERIDDETNPNGRNLVSIDEDTGAVTVIGPTIARLDALAFAPTAQVIPEPASLAAWGIAAFGAAVIARRRRR